MFNLVKIAICALIVAGMHSPAIAESNSSDITSGFDSIVSPEGNISLPTIDFRFNWALLGVWIVNGENDAKGMHNVYAEHGVVDHYRKTGQFPDGAVLVKELISTTAGDFTTGRISLATDIDGWFVMVKDQKGRFPNNSLWGDGWGWAFFESKDPKKLVTKNYKEECLTCHIPAKDTDWIYSEAYPVLGERRGGMERLRKLVADISDTTSEMNSQTSADSVMVDGELAEAGAKIFKRCAACHSVEPDKHKTGPSLAGLFGRKAGSATGFEYSEAMKNSNVVWNTESLDKHLLDVPNFIPGNRMGKVFRNGVKNNEQRKAIIEFLKSK